jgi:hypothetical protein
MTRFELLPFVVFAPGIVAAALFVWILVSTWARDRARLARFERDFGHRAVRDPRGRCW